ncbi:DUF6279 family lipoprotein [Glaciecola siphonariae]|uniref:DUF6279 family lipoprotein n=1 Tax=Glaciecola siphonariae TaxID=521012 RepID=A0ABV9LRR2_9ALTE
MKKIIVLFAVLLITGCSAKFAYKNLDWLVYWYVDDYVELNNEQEDKFDAYIAQWQAWHIQSELPKYKAHLEELSNDIYTQNISIERMSYHQQKARDHWYRLRAHIAPGMADMATTLSEEQITYFFAALEKENVEDEKERAKREEKSAQERKEAWIERNLDNLSDWLGKLNDEQKSFVENSYGRFRSNSSNWVSYKRAYQQAMRSEFASPDRGERFKQRMIALINNPEAYRSSEMIEVSEHNERETKLYMLSLFTLSDEKQRRHLIGEIEDLRDDVVDLAQ